MDVEPLLALYETDQRFDSDPPPTNAKDDRDLHESSAAGTHLVAPVDTFIARLSNEQARFLDAITQARLLLEGAPGQLAKTAALHSRLTQQFLDAQRSILRERAGVDADVARIEAEAEVAADTLIVTAHEQAAVMCADVLPGPDRSGVDAAKRGPRSAGVQRLTLDVTTPVNECSVRRQIPERDATAVRTHAAAVLIDSQIDTAFEPNNSAGAKAERQLRVVLDEWWTTEVQAGKAGIDDAEARAAMRVHAARAEASEMLEATRAMTGISTDELESTMEPVCLVPLPLFAALDAVDHEGLESLLQSLLDALGGEPVESGDRSSARSGAVPISGRSVSTGENLPSGSNPPNPLQPPVAQVVVNEEAFDRFWGAGSVPTAQWIGRQWVFVQVLRPMITVVAALVLVLAWIR